MDELAKLIPNSIVSLIGLAVIMGILIMLGTVFQEWAKSLYRRSTLAGKEKRVRDQSDYSGIERREENKNLAAAVTSVLEAMSENNREMREFIKAWKDSHQEMADNIDEIKRKQDNNWKRLFNEGVPLQK